jgi:hypothetical protein
MKLTLGRPKQVEAAGDDQVRAARIRAARKNPAWTEIDDDLVPRGRGWHVSAESDQIYTRYRGVAFQTGSAAMICDRAEIYYTVDGDDRLVLYEKQHGSWSQLIARQARRKRAAA